MQQQCIFLGFGNAKSALSEVWFKTMHSASTQSPARMAILIVNYSGTY